eukprot:1204634-Prymnesium_polylepis.1
MSREPALEVGGCPLTPHRPQVRRVTHTHSAPSACLVPSARNTHTGTRAPRFQRIHGDFRGSAGDSFGRVWSVLAGGL